MKRRNSNLCQRVGVIPKQGVSGILLTGTQRQLCFPALPQARLPGKDPYRRLFFLHMPNLSSERSVETGRLMDHNKSLDRVDFDMVPVPVVVPGTRYPY